MRRKVEAGMKNFLLALCVLLAVACSSDEPQTNNEYVNKWVQSQMQTYYLWNDEMPSPKKSQSPGKYFDQLLSDEDRFSWIQDDYEELLNSLQGINKEAGYECIFYSETGTSEVFGHIKYIKPNSPAATAGLKRGDVITHINGQSLTTANASDLIGVLNENHTIQYERYNFETEQWDDKGTLSLAPVQYTENPNYLHSIIEEDGHKIGYYVYNFFAPGTSLSPAQYNTEMNTIFSEFKSEGITDLIIDLRYNSGGSESATIKLASLIAPNVTTSDVFVFRQYNDLITQELADDEDLFRSNFTTETNNIGSQLSGKLYVITSRERTASASELLINGLRPYMDVIIVGGVTIGKNVGSISLHKENDPKNKWGMQPIVVKSFNSNMQSDYSTGFIPDFAISENQNDRVLLELGNPDEPLLAKTIEQITGIAARTTQQAKADVSELRSGIKGKNFNLLIDNPSVVQKIQKKLNPVEKSSLQ